MRPDNRGEGVISLRTAGDISLPRDRSRKGATSTMRGLIVPQGHNNPPTIIPLTHSRASRESGDYASSDVQVSLPSSSDDPGNKHERHFVNVAPYKHCRVAAKIPLPLVQSSYTVLRALIFSAYRRRNVFIR